MFLPRVAAVALAALCANVLAAPAPRLVKDINLGLMGAGSDPGGLATLGDVTLFFAEDDETGNELWRTDGTKAGTFLLRDIRPGEGSGVPDDRFGAIVVNGRVVFLADSGSTGLEYWSSDGTREGTVLLADIMPGAASSNPTFVSLVGSTMFFHAAAPETGGELWQTDGTPAGTRLALDLNPGSGSSFMRGLGRIGATIVFNGTDGANQGIFATDGTAQGTRFVAAALPFAGASFGSMVLFTVGGTGDTWTLMSTDGTSVTTVRSGFRGAPSSLLLRQFGNAIYFFADDGISGLEVWRTDGTNAGTHLVADLTPGAAGSDFSEFTMIGLRDRLVFATDGDNAALWSSDGTAAGTHPIKNLGQETFSIGTISGAFLYFAWDDGVHGRELWRTNGTADGTTLVADIAAGPEHPGIFHVTRRANGSVFFGADDGASGYEPWISDGTPSGTYLINIVAEKADGSSPVDFANIGGKLMFVADDGTERSLWRSDGTEAGTTSVGIDATWYGQPGARHVVSGGLYYFVNGEFPRLELWRSDGTIEGTFRLFQMSESRLFGVMVPFKNGLFFQGADDAHGAEPWFTDGTVAGTRLIADTKPGVSSGYTSTEGATVAGDYVYFQAEGPYGGQPWRTNGTTAHVLTTSSAETSQQPRAFTRVGDSVYFASYQHDQAFRLWRSSIATGETMLVRQFNGPSAPNAMWDVGGSLVMLLGNQVWRSDGTESGTVKVKDSVSVPFCHVREDYVVANGVLYWYSVDRFLPQLWRTDGTTTGTYRLAAFDGPFAWSLQMCLPHDLHYANGRLYLIGNDPLHGAEPWVSDGTIAGTRLLYDVNPGAAPSDPGWFTTIGSTLFFAATQGSSDRELWAFTIGCDGRECQPRRRAARH